MKHGAALVSYADAVVARAADVPERRDAVQKAMGDAAAIIANFQRMVRIADGAGIPIDAPVDAISADFRHELGIDGFSSAEGRGKSGPIRRLMAPLMRRMFSRALRARARKSG